MARTNVSGKDNFRNCVPQTDKHGDLKVKAPKPSLRLPGGLSPEPGPFQQLATFQPPLRTTADSNRGNNFQRFRDTVAETLRQYNIQIDSALLTCSLGCVWRCMSDTQKEHYRRPDVRIQSPRNNRVYNSIAQDSEWQPILQELGQRIINLYACQCNANAPSSCFYGTCTDNAEKIRTHLPDIHRRWSDHKYPREGCSSDDRTDGSSPATTSSGLSYVESLMPLHTTEAIVAGPPNVPSQPHISEFYTLAQDPGQFNPPCTNYIPPNSHPLHGPAIETATGMVDGCSGLLGKSPMTDPGSYAIYAVPFSSLQPQGVTSMSDTRHNISGTQAHQSFANITTNAPTTGVNTCRFYIVPKDSPAGRIVGQGWSDSSYQGANVDDARY